MKYGLTGHQSRTGYNWQWVTEKIDSIIRDWEPGDSGYSSLAAGTDQLFAERIIDRGFDHFFVLPTSDYEKQFKDNIELQRYIRMYRQSNIVNISSNLKGEAAFLFAGKWIVDNTDRIIAIWDEKSAIGKGGTADIVKYAKSKNKRIRVINPITCQDRTL